MPHGCSSNRPPSISPNSGHEKNAVAPACVATNPLPSSRTNDSRSARCCAVEIDLADAEEEDRVEVVQVARQELLAAGDAGALPEQDRRLGDRLRIGADDGVVEPGLPAEPLDRAQRVRDRLVLVAVADIGPGEHVLRKRFSGPGTGPREPSTTAQQSQWRRRSAALMRADYCAVAPAAAWHRPRSGRAPT